MARPKKVVLYIQRNIIDEVDFSFALEEVMGQQFSHLDKPTHREKIIYLLSYLYLTPMVNNMYSDRTDYVFISSGFLSKMLGEDYYLDILTFLINHNFIERNPKNYSKGVRTNSYRLKEGYLNYKFQSYQCCKNLARKQLVYRQQKNNKSISGGNESNAKHVYIKLKKILSEITIDFLAAEKYIYNQFIYSLKNPHTVAPPKKKKSSKNHNYQKKSGLIQSQREYRRLLQEAESIFKDVVNHQPLPLKGLKRILNKYHSDMISITRIRDKQWNFIVDPTSQRVHTNLTNISSELRQFIRLDGMPIKGRDLVNSQPVFLAMLLLEEYKGKEIPEDVELYIDLCLNGGFYEHLMASGGFTNRKSFKTLVYEKILFGKLPKKKWSKITKTFAKEFPNVWKYIVKAKSNPARGTDAYKELSILLQKMEQKMFIILSAAEVLKHIKCLTLHDAIYIQDTEQNVKLVDNIILNNFLKEYGATPKIDPLEE